MPKVAIAIATWKRPQMLQKALRSVENLHTDVEVVVLVADNDSEKKEGLAVVNRLTDRYRFPLSGVLVEQRGIPHARNALLHAAIVEAHADFVAFMDDDQWPEPGWLDALLTMQNQTRADVVASAVYADFEVIPPTWLSECGVYRRDTVTNGLVGSVYATCGVLLSADLTTRLPLPWLDASFGQTGNDDADLFWRLRDKGAIFARAAESKIHETYPKSRLTARWALQRAYRGGNGYVMIAMRHQPLFRVVVRECLKIPAAFLIAPLGLLFFLGQPARQFRVMLRLAVAIGKATALAGRQYREYAVSHGR
jgi:succinoglycan biosynthesis protein ExoM